MWRGFVYEVSSLIVDDVAYVAAPDRAGEPVHCVVSRVRFDRRVAVGVAHTHREVVLSNIE